jgi:hypothetical protein
MTLHSEILAMMRQAHPTLLTTRFRANMLDAFGAESPAVRRLLEQFRYVPDAYFLRKDQREVQVFEVIVWHGLTPQKLDAYMLLSDTFAAAGLKLELWSVDKGGRSGPLIGCPGALYTSNAPCRTNSPAQRSHDDVSEKCGQTSDGSNDT